MLRPPKTMFQDTVTLKKEVIDTDDPYGEKVVAETIKINNCRFTLRTVYSGTNNDRQVVSNASIVMMSTYTTPFIDFDPSYQGAKIVFNGREYTITTINRDIEPFSRKVYQYKLQVI
jgi:hypothetical protein